MCRLKRKNKKDFLIKLTEENGFENMTKFERKKMIKMIKNSMKRLKKELHHLNDETLQIILENVATTRVYFKHE